MKDIQNDVQKFYPSAWGESSAYVAMGLIFLISAFFYFPRAESGIDKTVIFCVCALGGSVMFLYGLTQMFDPSPVCVLYPDRVRVKKKELLWEQVKYCYMGDIWKGGGKTRELVHVLVFLPKSDTAADPLILRLSEVSVKDREILQKEIVARGVPFLPEKLQSGISASISRVRRKLEYGAREIFEGKGKMK